MPRPRPPVTPEKASLFRGLLALLTTKPLPASPKTWKDHFAGREALYLEIPELDGEPQKIKGIPVGLEEPDRLMITVTSENPLMGGREDDPLPTRFNPNKLRDMVDVPFLLAGSTSVRKKGAVILPPEITMVIGRKDFKKFAVKALRLLANPIQASEVLGNMTPAGYRLKVRMPSSEVSQMINKILVNGGFATGDPDLVPIMEKAFDNGNDDFAIMLRDFKRVEGAHTLRILRDEEQRGPREAG